MAATNAPWRDEGTLREKYLEDGQTSHELADRWDCDPTTVTKWLRRYEIPTRTAETPEELTDEKTLRQLYVEQDMSTTEIGDRVDRSHETVRYWLDEHGIERRPQCPVEYPELHDESWLEEQYVENERSTAQIAAELGCWPCTVAKRLRESEIKTRPPMSGRPGSDHYLWEGGRLDYGEGWTASKREAVRERDDHQCQSCGASAESVREEFGRKLDVHHITPARQMDDSDERNAMENLISLCAECHRSWERMAPLKPETATN